MSRIPYKETSKAYLQRMEGDLKVCIEYLDLLKNLDKTTADSFSAAYYTAYYIRKIETKLVVINDLISLLEKEIKTL
jgi:hypothetical protein